MTALDETLSYLLDNDRGLVGKAPQDGCSHAQLRYHQEDLVYLETSAKLQLLREALCTRSPIPRLPEKILRNIDAILTRGTSHKLVLQAGSLTPTTIMNSDKGRKIKMYLWKGDITTLTGVQAITNAANEKMLGCFQPTHRCIDNVIHSWAGPRLRSECFELMQARGQDLNPGDAVTSSGHSLLSPYVIHTLGPQLSRGRPPTDAQKHQLAKCYSSVLECFESLPAGVDGSKRLVLCGISTGLFAFPVEIAAEVAVETVSSWLIRRPDTTITDVIFNVFRDDDYKIYDKILQANLHSSCNLSDIKVPPLIDSESIYIARQWLQSAEAVLVSAGAGLSAADGLDYSSTALFNKHFPAFRKYGLSTLYSVFGFTGWPTEQDRWGYYFTHLHMVQTWPKSPIYDNLITWLRKYGPNAHVRTSNADGLFQANGWPAEQTSTPQGSYSFLQCLNNCRPGATVYSSELVSETASSLNPVSQRLVDADKIPQCRFCGGKMNICVRAGSWFNEEPFRAGEKIWKEWKTNIMKEKKKLVILELGVGLNTPGVLRWPNEDLTLEANGHIKFVRVGLGPEAVVPFDMEENGVAVTVQGDLGIVLSKMLS